jgi:hypothetical protein
MAAACARLTRESPRIQVSQLVEDGCQAGGWHHNAVGGYEKRRDVSGGASAVWHWKTTHGGTYMKSYLYVSL